MYGRTAGQSNADYFNSKQYEEEIRSHLGPYVVDRTGSNTELDFWMPGPYIEVKEKNQVLTPRWHVLPDVAEPDLFVLDELSLRKLCDHWPYAYCVLHDKPCERLFIASCVELAVAERARLQRVGKAKLVYDLTNFARLNGPAEILPYIMQDLTVMAWKRSEALGHKLVKQV